VTPSPTFIVYSNAIVVRPDQTKAGRGKPKPSKKAKTSHDQQGFRQPPVALLVYAVATLKLLVATTMLCHAHLEARVMLTW
jgi:hypothetical protein